MTGNDLKALRKKHNLTQSGFAQVMDLPDRGRTTVSEWENGKRPISAPYVLAIELMFGLRKPYAVV